jgi:hypothetical protein
MLNENMTYVGAVVGMKEGASNFKPSHMPGIDTMWCHEVNILFEVTGEVLPCQYCSEHPKVTEFGINDIIKVRATKFTKGLQSVKFIEKMARARPIRAAEPVKEKETFGGYEDRVSNPSAPWEVTPSKNPVVSGTAADRALYNACHFHQMQGGITAATVLETAEEFYYFLLNKSK